MPLVRSIVQITPRDAIVKWVGQGADTLALTDLVRAGQSVSGNPFVGISGVLSSVAGGGSCAITRNGVDVFHVHGEFEFQTDSVATAVITENGSSDIVVNLANTGTLILKLRKISGYSDVLIAEIIQ